MAVGRASSGSTTGGAEARAQLVKLDFPVPAAHALPSSQEVRARGARRPARAGRLRRGQPRLQASLPALPDPARVRRPLLRRPGGDGAGRRAPAGGGRGDPHDVRRSRLPQRAPPRARGRPRAPRRVPARDVRLHRQGRAPARPARAPGRAGRARLRVRRLGGGVARRHGARAPGQGAHARRHRGGAAGDARGRHRAAADLGGVHPVDDAGRLPRAGSTSSRPRGWWTTSTPCSTASACWCRRARSCSTCRRCAPTSASWCPAASTTAGRIPIRASIASPTRSRPAWPPRPSTTRTRR